MYKKGIFLMSTMLMTAACSVGPDYVSPDIQIDAPISESSANTTDKIEDAVLAKWWESFNDPELNQLVESALANNFDIAKAIARIAQARGALKLAKADLLPSARVVGSAGERQNSLTTEIGALFNQGLAPRETEFYEIGLDAGWELDIFGGRRYALESARAQKEIAIEGTMAARSSIAAETVRLYYEIYALNARINVAERAIKSSEDLESLTRLRSDEGLNPKLDLLQAEALATASRAALPPLVAAEKQARNALGILLGERNGKSTELAFTGTFEIATPIERAMTSPADIVRRRPDVRAAEQAYIASSANVGVVAASFYPRITLGGAVSYSGLNASDLFTGDALQYSVGPGFSWRLFDWGRLRGEMQNAKGRRAETLASYEQSVLRALAEVENSLVALSSNANTIIHLENNRDALSETRDIARVAYTGGIVSFLQVLDAQRALDMSEDRVIAARLATVKSAISTYQALGGGWSDQDRLSAIETAYSNLSS